MTTQRPTLILGGAAKEFLAERRARTKRPLAPDELYCLSCKAPRKPFAGMVQLEEAPGKPTRITGFCDTCETICSRVVGSTQIVRLPEIFDLDPNRGRAA